MSSSHIVLGAPLPCSTTCPLNNNVMVTMQIAKNLITMHFHFIMDVQDTTLMDMK